MKTRTLLVDGSYLLKRSFHGAKDLQTTSFGHIGGLYSFLTTVRKLINEYKINRVVLMWDGENGGVQRHRIDRFYKANRKSKKWHKQIEMSAAEIRREKQKDESILKQRLRIKAYCEELFLRNVEDVDTEADDLIAAYCLEYNNKEEIFIYSNDRDFAQLLDLNITIIFPNIDQPVTKINYMMYFNHHYSNALIMKIICGDTSDNIKGISGLKDAGLIKLFPEIKFQTFTVREICKKADEMQQERLKNKKKPLLKLTNLISPEGIERLKLNYKLVNLREPMLTENAYEELDNLKYGLSSDDRGSKNLYNYMIEDEFLGIYGSTFPQYVQPFYTVIMHEKSLYQ